MVFCCPLVGSHIGTVSPVPPGLKAGEHPHDLQHHRPAMTKILPRAKHAGGAGIDVVVGIRNEDIVGRGSAPGEELIEEAVRWNSPVINAAFRGGVDHG
jgi:hypothetical protein